MNSSDSPIDPVPNPDSGDASGPSSPPLGEGTENFYTGSEPFFTYFTQAQVLLSTLRLTLDGRLIVSTSDLGALMEATRRGFLHTGNLLIATQDSGRISSLLSVRVKAWEREVQSYGREKRQMSGAQIQRLKAEATLIRGKILAIERAMVKLEVLLHQMTGEARKESTPNMEHT